MESRKMVEMSLFKKQKQSHRCREKTMITKGASEEGGINWEIGTNVCTLLCIKQITNENLQYSTGNSTQ